MKLTKKTTLALLASIGCAGVALASDYNAASKFNPLRTGVNSLDIVPDSRGAAMGDLGVATDPDANSQFWNSSKYAFAYSQAGVSMSYTPWLRKLVNDIALLNLAGYWKVGANDNQAVSAQLRYFTLGEVTSGDSEISPLMTLHPYEMSFDMGYSRKLSENFSMGVVFRYIYSDLAFTESDSDNQTVGASAFAADINGYLTTFPMVGNMECQWAWGFNLSNIGSKVNYDRGANPAFLPAQLRLGTSFTFPLADYHLLSLNCDASRIMVPARPNENNYDMQTEEGQKSYQNALKKWQNMSPITGIFNSFSDAPRGLAEELEEIRYSIGAEYSYNDQFFLRGGYYYEHPNKGDRQYLGLGAGFAMKVMRLDASYMVATAATSPLDQTLRFSITFDMDGLKELFGQRR